MKKWGDEVGKENTGFPPAREVCRKGGTVPFREHREGHFQNQAFSSTRIADKRLPKQCSGRGGWGRSGRRSGDLK